MNARLDARRSNTEPKCCNCGWWSGGEGSAGKCGAHDIKTLDLSVCATWRDGEVIQDVMAPQEPWPEGVPKWRTEE